MLRDGENPQNIHSLIYPISCVTLEYGASLWELGLEPGRWEHKVA